MVLRFRVGSASSGASGHAMANYMEREALGQARSLYYAADAPDRADDRPRDKADRLTREADAFAEVRPDIDARLEPAIHRPQPVTDLGVVERAQRQHRPTVRNDAVAGLAELDTAQFDLGGAEQPGHPDRHRPGRPPPCRRNGAGSARRRRMPRPGRYPPAWPPWRRTRRPAGSAGCESGGRHGGRGLVALRRSQA